MEANERDQRVTEGDVRRFFTWATGFILVLAALLLLLWNYIVVTILPGHVGVLYSWLFGGTRAEKVYGEGIALKWPWNRMYIVETRVQTQDYEVTVLSQEGLYLRFDISAVFRVDPKRAGRLVRELGPDFTDRIVRPLVTGSVRQMVSRFGTHELYTIDFRSLEKQIYDLVKATRYGEIIDFHYIVVRKVILPETMARAIEDKLAQEQSAASYIFRLEMERQEAERKRIEAIGIQNFYSVVSQALTPNLLTWRGIEATVALSRSPNSKIVVVGGGKDQMPLILGGDIHNLPTPKAVAPVPSSASPLPDWDRTPRLFPNSNITSEGVIVPEAKERLDENGAPLPASPLKGAPAKPPAEPKAPEPAKGGAQAPEAAKRGAQAPEAARGFSSDRSVSPFTGDGEPGQGLTGRSVGDPGVLRQTVSDEGLRNRPPVQEGFRVVWPRVGGPTGSGQPLGLER
jgi:regulator of protease activity HflC (stomatin/prohibitin superfamily)